MTPLPSELRLALGRAQASIQLAPRDAAVAAIASTLLELARIHGTTVDALAREVVRLAKAGQP